MLRYLFFTLSLFCSSFVYAQEPTSLVTEAPTSAPALPALMPEQATAEGRPAAKALLLASVSGKLIGLSFGALKLQDTLFANNNSFALIVPRSPLFNEMFAVGWGFAAVSGGAAYIVDDTVVKPWMFYTEVISYGAIGLGLGTAALFSAFDESANPENAKILGVRSAIFFSASGAAAGAAYLLKHTK